MPPVIAAAGVAAATAFTTAGVSAAVAGTSITAALISTTTIVSAVTSAALAGAAAALQMSMQQTSRQPPNALLRQPIPTSQVVYGRARVGGALAMYHRTEDGSRRDMMMVCVLACHEIDGVEKIYDGDNVMWTEGGGLAGGYAGKVSVVNVHTGTDTQTADADLLSALPTTLAGATGTNLRLRGHAYVVIRIEKVTKKWTKGMPRLSFLVRGAKVYDPRDLSTAWSDNWALCTADYMTRDRGGAGVDWADLDEDAIIASANTSDETVLTLTTTQPRYRVSGAFSTDAAPRDNLAAMMALGGGKIVDSGGLFQIHAGAYSAPVVTIGPGDMVAPLQIDGAVTMEQMIDGVRAVYSNPDAQYELDDAPAVLFSDYDPADGAARWLDMRFDREQSAERAQRLAVLAGRMTRRAIKATVSVMVGFGAIEAGDRITLEHGALGLSDVFEVQAATLHLTPAGPRVDLELLIDGAAYWAWTAETATEAPAPGPSNLPSARTVEPPTGLTLTASAPIGTDGTARPTVLVEWTASDDFYLDGYEVRWTPSGGVERSIRLGAAATQFAITGEAEGAAIDVEVVAINALGYESDAATSGAGVAPPPDTTAPGVPTSFSVAGGVDRLVLSWINPTDADFARVLIRESATAVFGASAEIGETAATMFETPGLVIGTTRYYWAAAVDWSGNVSAWAGPISATVIGAGSGNIIDGAVETDKIAVEAVTDFAIEFPPATTVGSSYAEIGSLSVLAGDGDYLIEGGFDPTNSTGTLTWSTGSAGTVALWCRVSLYDDTTATLVEQREAKVEGITVTGSGTTTALTPYRMFAAAGGAEVVSGHTYRFTIEFKYIPGTYTTVTSMSTVDDCRAILRAHRR